MSLQYSDTSKRILADHRDEVWVERELMMSRLEIEEFEPTVEKEFVSHCPSGLYILKFHLLHHVLEDLERFGSSSFTDARLFEHFNVFIRQSCRTMSRRFSTWLRKTVQSTGRTVQNV